MTNPDEEDNEEELERKNQKTVFSSSSSYSSQEGWTIVNPIIFFIRKPDHWMGFTFL